MGTFTNTDPSPLPKAGFRPTFFDGFDGAYLDRAAWPLVLSGPANNGAYAFVPEAVVEWDGEVAVSSFGGPNGWNSGAFQQGWNGQLYGRYEIRAAFDPGQGITGAILLWPTDGSTRNEVDLIESRNADRTLNAVTVHDQNSFVSESFNYDAKQYHTYAVDWLPGSLTIYLDGQVLYRTTERVLDQPMSLGFLGYVNSWTDLWQGGPPDATTPGFSSMHVDWVRISTPEDRYPGALPTALYGAELASGSLAVRPTTEAWTGTWTAGNTGELARTGVRDLGGTAYAATWNAGEWGSLGTVASRPTAWDPAFAGRLAYANFEQAELDLRAAGAAPLDVVVTGARRGDIATGGGADRVTWIAHSDTAVPGNLVTIITGDGNDQVTLTAPALSGLDELFAWGSRWQGGYAGQASTATVSAGAGDDRVVLLAGSAIVDGGSGVDTVVFAGNAARYVVQATAEGATYVTDPTGALGPTLLWGVERLAFADGEMAAPGQAAFARQVEIIGIVPTLGVSGPASSVALPDWHL